MLKPMLGYRRALRSPLFCSFLLLVSLVGCDRSPQLSPLHDNSTILAFGASLTYGSGVVREQSYPTVLSQRLGINVINAGLPGEITADGLKRLPALLQQHQPRLVLISHGGNDILKKIDADITKANLKQMIELIRAQGGEVVLIAIPQPALLPSAAPFYAELAEEMSVPVELDIVTRLQKSAQYKSDPIHFNAEGYALMAEAVAELLRARGALE